MAAKEVVNSDIADVELVVNRWLLEYYYSLALDLFQKKRYKDFLGIRNILDSVLERPLEVTDTTQTKVRVLQFLSRINDGESLDVSFEADHSPLESALVLLENINKEFSIPLQDFEIVCTSLREMMVSILIQNSEFNKAEEVLKKYFPKPMVGKKAIFMGLIRQKSQKHEVIEQIDFQRFKEEMFAFCQKFCPLNVPFLHKVAKTYLSKRLEEADDNSPCSEEKDEPGPSSNPKINTRGQHRLLLCNCRIISRSKLEAAYMDLVAGSDEKTFAQLNKEVRREEQAHREFSLNLPPSSVKATNRDSEQNGSFQRSDSPMEASPADQPPQRDADPRAPAGSLSKTTSGPKKRRLYTVAQLVLEPDSQVSLQCTAASQDLETEVRSKEPLRSAATPSTKDLLNPVADIEVAIPKRKLPRQARKICSSDSESMSESQEDPHGLVVDREICMEKLHNQSSSSLSKNPKFKQSTDREEDLAPCKNPVQKPHEPPDNDPLSKQGVPENADEVCIIDSSLDSSPRPFRGPLVPQKSSTPHKDSTQDKDASHSKWKRLMNNAKESKETWDDEESHFFSRPKRGTPNESTISNSGNRKRMWTDHETKRLAEGVRKFGEGNWTKILTYYSFNGRTNVQLKDRWRTMKKLKWSETTLK